jgi:hypothetical protein
MRSEIGDDVVMRLANSAKSSLAAMPSSYNTGSAQDQPVAQAGVLEAIAIGYSRRFSIENDLSLSLKGS